MKIVVTLNTQEIVEALKGYCKDALVLTREDMKDCSVKIAKEEKNGAPVAYVFIGDGKGKRIPLEEVLGNAKPNETSA